jgi:hypothetical protein
VCNDPIKSNLCVKQMFVDNENRRETVFLHLNTRIIKRGIHLTNSVIANFQILIEFHANLGALKDSNTKQKKTVSILYTEL